MKGLLLKDFYMTWKYCRMVFIFVIIFLVAAATGAENVFFLIYPMVVAAIIPTTLLSYDEKSGWNVYCGVLPYSRAQLVSVKYLVAAIIIFAVWILSILSQIICIAAGVSAEGEEIRFTLSFLLLLGLLSSSIILPVIFRFGVEKGRYAYYFTIAFICAAGFAAAKIIGEINLNLTIQANLLPVIMAAAGIAIFCLSWLLSIKIYQKQEI